jgi:DNA-binding transcriptional MerR regulator
MRIGELAGLTGISARMLRHYDAIGLLPPSGRSANGYRDYTAEDVRRLFRVESLRALGLPLQAIRDTLRDSEIEPTALVDELIERTQRRIAREEALLARLRSVRESGAGSWQEVLELVALLQGLGSPDPSTRQRVALAGEAMPAGSLLDALLGEADPNVAGALQWTLMRTTSPAAVLPGLVEALGSPDAQARRRAVEALVKLDGAEEALREALRHRDSVVRARAALALGRRGRREAVPELVEMVVRGTEDVAAAETLGLLARDHGEVRVADLVVARLEREGPAARGRLTQTLGEIPGAAAHRALTMLADDQDPAVSLTARYLLARG